MLEEFVSHKKGAQAIGTLMSNKNSLIKQFEKEFFYNDFPPSEPIRMQALTILHTCNPKYKHAKR